MAEPRERPPAGPRYAFPDPKMVAVYGLERCLDCGSLIYTEDKPAHTRFHSILGGHAWTLAVLKTSHIAAHIHDKYDVAERINSRKFDSWSGEALAEVLREHGLDQVPDGAP